MPTEIVHLRAAGVSLVLDARDGFVPAVLHWGHDLGELDAGELAALAVASRPTAGPNDLDAPRRAPALLPQHALGWNGRPGLAGSRGGRGWSPLFRLTELAVDGGRVAVAATDDDAGLAVASSMSAALVIAIRSRCSTGRHCRAPSR